MCSQGFRYWKFIRTAALYYVFKCESKAGNKFPWQPYWTLPSRSPALYTVMEMDVVVQIWMPPSHWSESATPPDLRCINYLYMKCPSEIRVHSPKIATGFLVFLYNWTRWSQACVFVRDQALRTDATWQNVIYITSAATIKQLLEVLLKEMKVMKGRKG